MRFVPDVAVVRLGPSVRNLIVVALLITVFTDSSEPVSATSYRWDAPVLSDPELVKLPAGSSYTRLARNRDYVINLPNKAKVGYTMIEGGRNILIRGGHLVVPAGGESDTERRGIYIKNATGIVHIEGLLIEGKDTRGFDGIAISAPAAIVQIVNVRVESVSGRFDGFHGDIVQPFGGVRELRIDHLTGTSNYQGLYLAETSGRIRAADIRNVDLDYAPNDFDATTYLLWLPVDSQRCETYPIRLESVYIEPRPGQDVAGYAVWPNSVRPAACTANKDGAAVSWPDLTDVDGAVTPGSPPGGDFVPEGSVGVDYSNDGADHTGEAEPSPSATPAGGGRRGERGRAVGGIPRRGAPPGTPNERLSLVYGSSL